MFKTKRNRILSQTSLKNQSFYSLNEHSRLRTFFSFPHNFIHFICQSLLETLTNNLFSKTFLIKLKQKNQKHIIHGIKHRIIEQKFNQ